MNAQRTGAPAECTCEQVTVATLAETLRCPALWKQLPDGRWTHDWWPLGRRPAARTRGVNR